MNLDTRFNAYRIMWLFVFFDLPTGTNEERKAYTVFREKIMADGFTMKQYSVYTRFCMSRQEADVHYKRINDIVPDKGLVSVLMVTDKQFGMIVNYWGKNIKPPQKESTDQLLLF